MSRPARLALWCLAATVLATPRLAAAQIPDHFENLQVLPKDIPRDTLIAVMRSVATSLGVRCQFCHAERAAAPGERRGGMNLDFPSDVKKEKRTARVMMRMVDSINHAFLPTIPERDVPPTTVSCITCHRGLPKPTTIQAVLLRTTERAGVDSAILRYRALHEDMVSGRYDFREGPVSDVAEQLAARGRFDDAIRLLQMNQEFHPNSVNLDFQLAEVYLAKGDRDQGIARLRAVLTKNPNDRRARARLQQLGVEP